ncbi:MAG: helix-turn-helix transcriptional regulator [Oscillospiraceae bacterium]|jgi:transcriptional regulator with XRE-family HTH domain|nr:helix-turn-helix transcriptional regulator [Oscillospiraceae bacterium]
MSKFSERLRDLRTEKGVTQKQLGELLNVKNFSIYTYEKGRSEPNIDGLIALADFFEVSVDYLVGHTDNRKSSL